MLETVGATLDDVELIDVGFDLMSAMTTGNVDATFGCFINHEVPALEEEASPWTTWRSWTTAYPTTTR